MLTRHGPRQQAVSFLCHLAVSINYPARHRQCDGKSYTTSITDKGKPCACTCHQTPEGQAA